MSTEIIILSQCEKELKKFPSEVLDDFLDAITKLKNGLALSMPLSRPMVSIARGLHELRLKKTTQKTPEHAIEVIQGRIRAINEKI